jgi:hypothetical protein
VPLEEEHGEGAADQRGRRRAAGLVLPFLVLVFVHMLSGVQAEQPLILADELGYLGNARYLAGTAPLPDRSIGLCFSAIGAGVG